MRRGADQRATLERSDQEREAISTVTKAVTVLRERYLECLYKTALVMLEWQQKDARNARDRARRAAKKGGRR